MSKHPLRLPTGEAGSDDSSLRPSPTAIDRSVGLPLWLQLKMTLSQKISSGEYPPDGQLPSEPQICKIYGLSRTVVREALAQLVLERKIYKVHGKGAFVLREKPADSFVSSNIGLSGEMIGKGRTVHTRVLEQVCASPTERERELLDMREGAKVYRILRTQSVDGVVRALTRTSLNLDLVPEIDRINLENQSLYDVLRRRYGITPARSRRWIEATMPSSHDAGLLGIERSKPVLGIESIAHDADGRGIEYYFSLYRSDISRIMLEVG